jgi:hypothetical protein
MLSAAPSRLSRYRAAQSTRRRHQGHMHGGGQRRGDDMCTHDCSLLGGGNGSYDDSVLSAIEIPGQYALTCSRFREPRPDLHVKLVRVLPRVRPVCLAGEVLRYQVQILGSDGQHVPYNVSLKSAHASSSSGNEVGMIHHGVFVD